jgi:GNAT superfamily N-acetyltransferase
VDLCRRLDLDASYLSRILGDFGDRGWVERMPSAEDARKNTVALTPAGREAFAPLNEASRRQLEAWLAPLPESHREALVSAMHTVMELLEGKQATRTPLVVIRAHRPGDMGWVIERQARLYADEYGFNQEFEALVAEICARFLRRFDAEREHCWIAEWDGRRVGSVTVVAKSKTTAQLRMVFVEADARGLGIGRKLMVECLMFARRAGYRKMILYTVDCLHSARRMYEAAGFKLTKSEPHHSFGRDLVGQYWERPL